MNEIKYSIVVCAYNEEKYLKGCIQSLIDQEFDNKQYEIIIVDNESSDQTAVISTDFLKNEDNKNNPLIKYFRIKHVGLSSSRNFAVKQSVGDIIIFIDGDAITDNKLIYEYDKVFANESCDYSGGRIELLNKKSRLANILQNTKYKQIFTGSRRKNYLHGANMAFRKTIFSKYNFIENFYSRGDDSSFITIISNHYIYCAAEKAIVYHERPEKLSEWAKITFTEMELFYKIHTLIYQYTGNKDTSFSRIFISNILILTSLFLTYFSPFFLLLTTLLIIYFKRQFFHSYENMAEVSFSILMISIHIIFLPIIFVYSYLKYRNEQIITSINIEIIKSKTTKDIK